MATPDPGSIPKPPPLPNLRRKLEPPGDDSKAGQEAAGADRRAFRRVSLEAEVNFLGHDNFYTGFTEDISEGGLFVSTYQLLELGTHVDLRFTLPDGTELEVKAVVRWVRAPRDQEADVPPGMGLQFVDLGRQEHASIGRFISKREPLFYED